MNERTPIKGRVVLLANDRHDADRLAGDLDAAGWSCAVGYQDGVLALDQIRKCRPVATIVEVSQSPDRGIAAAAAVRADPTMSTMPIVFIGANKLVDKVNAAVPDAIFASRGALDYVLSELVKAPRS